MRICVLRYPSGAKLTHQKPKMNTCAPEGHRYNPYSQKAIEYEFPTHNPKMAPSEHRIQQIQLSDWTLLE